MYHSAWYTQFTHVLHTNSSFNRKLMEAETERNQLQMTINKLTQQGEQVTEGQEGQEGQGVIRSTAEGVKHKLKTALGGRESSPSNEAEGEQNITDQAQSMMQNVKEKVKSAVGGSGTGERPHRQMGSHVRAAAETLKERFRATFNKGTGQDETRDEGGEGDSSGSGSVRSTMQNVKEKAKSALYQPLSGEPEEELCVGGVPPKTSEEELRTFLESRLETKLGKMNFLPSRGCVSLNGGQARNSN